MTQRKKTFFLAIASLPPIALGATKVYLHINSPYRLGILDYFVSAGLILSGILLVFPLHSKIFLFITVFLIGAELFKAIIDYRDSFDFSISLIAIFYLGMSVLRYYHANAATERPLKTESLQT